MAWPLIKEWLAQQNKRLSSLKRTAIQCSHIFRLYLYPVIFSRSLSFQIKLTCCYGLRGFQVEMRRERLLLQHAAFLCWGKIYIIKARLCLFSEILEQNLPRYLHITVFLHKKISLKQTLLEQ